MKCNISNSCIYLGACVWWVCRCECALGRRSYNNNNAQLVRSLRLFDTYTESQAISYTNTAQRQWYPILKFWTQIQQTHNYNNNNHSSKNFSICHKTFPMLNFSQRKYFYSNKICCGFGFDYTILELGVCSVSTCVRNSHILNAAYCAIERDICFCTYASFLVYSTNSTENFPYYFSARHTAQNYSLNNAKVLEHTT